MLLEDVIAHHLDSLFPGMEIADYDYFRVTRDADLAISDEADDLLQAVEEELRRRRLGEVVRVEVGARIAPRLLGELTTALDVSPRDVYPIDGMLDLTGLLELTRLPGYAELRDVPYTPVAHPRILADEERRADVMGAMRDGDLLVHHPYDSFSSSVERFVEQAVDDPQVLAIKQTVYRTSDDSPLVPALIRAAERGKQAVCLVELQARFDERTNIHWAKALEQAGVHVVYGHPALKTHAKCVLVVRREGDGVRNYVHIGTGNYHSATARLYTDFGLFTTDEAIGADVAELFNYLTGFGRPSGYRKVLVAPSYLRNAILDEIAAGDRRPLAGVPGADHDQDQLARRPRLHRGAVPRLARRGARRPQRARHLLPAPGRARDLREHPRRLGRRALPRALARLRVRATTAPRRSTSPRPT